MLCRLFVSSKGINWRNINDSYFNLSCQPRAEDKEYFYIRVSNDTIIHCVFIMSIQVKPVAHHSIKACKLTNSEMERRPHHVFHLYYPVLFYNMLPIAIATITTSVST